MNSEYKFLKSVVTNLFEKNIHIFIIKRIQYITVKSTIFITLIIFNFVSLGCGLHVIQIINCKLGKVLGHLQHLQLIDQRLHLERHTILVVERIDQHRVPFDLGQHLLQHVPGVVEELLRVQAGGLRRTEVKVQVLADLGDVVAVLEHVVHDRFQRVDLFFQGGDPFGGTSRSGARLGWTLCLLGQNAAL